MLCEACQKVFSGPLPNNRWLPKFGSRHYTESQIHHASIEDFYQSAQNGCFVCGSVWRSLIAQYAADLLGDQDLAAEQKSGSLVQAMRKGSDVDQGVFSMIWIGNAPKSKTVLSHLYVHTRNIPATKEYNACPPQYRKHFWLASSIHFFGLTLRPEHSLGRVLDTERAPTTGSHETMDIIRWWLRDCIDNHNECKENASLLKAGKQWLPTRLLEILPDQQTVRIINTAGRSIDNYATLSHCWGQVQPLTLTNASSTSLYAGISIIKLPRTFAEAVDVANHMSIKYLWIDSLCIFQDSVEDWQVESTRMDTVYGGALCNIAATDSSDCTGGLFRTRDSFFPFQTSVYTYDKEHSTGNVEIWRPHEGKWHQSFQSVVGPLLQRAWVVQERAMAKRVIHFAKDEVFWECFHHSASEGYPYLLDSNLTLELSAVDFKRLIGNFDQSPIPSDLASRMQSWKALVSQYTRCKLTREDDRLVALSGLAKRFRASIGHRYLAGIWEIPDFPAQLCWYTDRTIDSDTFLSDNSESSGPYLAPSWAWPSVKVPIARWLELKPHVELQILHVGVTPKGPDDTGQVVDGILRVKARLYLVFCAQGQFRYQHHFQDRIKAENLRRFPVSFNGAEADAGVADYPDPFPPMNFLGDTKFPGTEGPGRHALYLGKCDENDLYMVLQPGTNARGSFQRCGLLETQRRHFYSHTVAPDDQVDMPHEDWLDRRRRSNITGEHYPQLEWFEEYDPSTDLYTISIV